MIIKFIEKSILHRELKGINLWHQYLFDLSISIYSIFFLILNILYLQLKRIKVLSIFAGLIGILSLFWLINTISPQYDQRIHELETLGREIKTAEPVGSFLTTEEGDLYRLQFVLSPRKINSADIKTRYIICYINDEVPNDHVLLLTTDNFALYEIDME
ncbi:hypothetical protein TREPR_0015 [Treponema primitia ZAS-2]|uniref:Uncharacterized protein n=2 Tax=Treponema primitia TaxID=88058 RepID=F5YNY9_TREPZ|nr:hypothetical protein TREPR_0015 [Treponema primitia ZAS-2]